MPSLIKKEIVPFLGQFLALLLISLAADFFLHKLNLLWVGRYLGYVGSGLILISFVYSLRKRRFINSGSPKLYLLVHEYLGWFGALMILIHGGIHFNGLLGWLAMSALLATVISGLTGQLILKRSKALVALKKARLSKEGLDSIQMDERLYWDSVALDMMKRWRSIHSPITAVFLSLAILHVIAVFFFWGGQP